MHADLKPCGRTTISGAGRAVSGYVGAIDLPRRATADRGAFRCRLAAYPDPHLSRAMIATVVEDDGASADIGKESLAMTRFMIDCRPGSRRPVPELERGLVQDL